jgi:hypothetical protein
LWVAATHSLPTPDFGWFSHFLHCAEPPDDVDFWRPSPHGLKATPARCSSAVSARPTRASPASAFLRATSELALNECRPGNPHTVNDATKLAGPVNEIKYGYLLFFVRDSRDYERNKAEVWENLEEAASRVRVVFAHVDGARKPKPVYLGAWGIT